MLSPSGRDDKDGGSQKQRSRASGKNAYARSMSVSDSGFESRDAVKPKFRKFSVGPALEKQKMAEKRKVHFRALAAERRSASIALANKFEIPEPTFSNISNITGKKVKKKVYKHEKVTLQSIMNRSWNDIIENINDTDETGKIVQS